MSEYEVVECRKPGKELADYEIRIKGAGKGTPKVATVWGHYGVDAKAIAQEVATALYPSPFEVREENIEIIRQVLESFANPGAWDLNRKFRTCPDDPVSLAQRGLAALREFDRRKGEKA